MAAHTEAHTYAELCDSHSDDEEMESMLPLPPGFRFHPTEEELICYYLQRKVTTHACERWDQLFRCEPWDLSAGARTGRVGLDRPGCYRIINNGILEELRYLHHDRKPSNILLDSDMNPKLSDFGISRMLSPGVEEEFADRIMGSTGFIGPECWERRLLSTNFDVYRFGVLIHAIITGKGCTSPANVEGHGFLNEASVLGLNASVETPIHHPEGGLVSSGGSDPAAAGNSSMTPSKTPEPTWQVASAAPNHMTGDVNQLRDYTPAPGDRVVHVPSMGPLRVHGSGSVSTATITLQDVLHVPGLDKNLVSTSQLAKLGYTIALGPSGCRITKDDEDETLVGKAHFTDDYLFELDFLRVPSGTN